ncbi:Transient receptor potential (TRP) ion channel [Microdochium nivale]|nr:Transient receptor potential (TRP) ion channel [Microdochium nivale]
MARWNLRTAALWSALLVAQVTADDILTTSGFTNCNSTSDISVDKVDVSYNAAAKTVTFDLAGSSNKVQNVTATLRVTAYGQEVFSQTFEPCDPATFVAQLCPVPAGTFAARGTQAVPAEAAAMIPSIAFQIPDIAAFASVHLENIETGSEAGCVQSQVSNGKTASIPSVSYVAAGIAGAALILSGVSAASAGLASVGASAAGGTGTMSPGFTEVMGVFQSYASYGMLSVNLPPVYRGFTKNFGFSMGIVPWSSMQISIDNFRENTGGNITNDSFMLLRNTTLRLPDGTAVHPSPPPFKRAVHEFLTLAARQIETEVNGTTSGAPAPSGIESTVSGIEAYVEQMSVPSANSFMTVLLITAIVIAVIIFGMLLVKVVLEAWSIWGTFPESLKGFREHYWGSIARSITSLIMILYSVWVLYSVFQFTHGDSWAAQTLAGVTLALFTGVLAFFTWKIWKITRKLKESEGTTAGLYEDKATWVKYSLFYESYKKDYWWIFVPVILYMLSKGLVMASLRGSGMAQTIGLIVVEALMLGVLLWNRPFERKSSNVINIAIQVVRVLSVVCILVFVDQLGISQSTQTVVGVVLIVIQSGLAGVLAILLVWNAIILCCKKNPHRERRKQMEKERMQREADELTPLDARNTLLMGSGKESTTTFAVTSSVMDEKKGLYEPMPGHYRGNSYDRAEPMGVNNLGPPGTQHHRALTPTPPFGQDPVQTGLLGDAAPISGQPGYAQGYNGGYNQGGYGGYRGGY